MRISNQTRRLKSLADRLAPAKQREVKTWVLVTPDGEVVDKIHWTADAATTSSEALI